MHFQRSHGLPRSPDLRTLDFNICGFLAHRVYADSPRSFAHHSENQNMYADTLLRISQNLKKATGGVVLKCRRTVFIYFKSDIMLFILFSIDLLKVYVISELNKCLRFNIRVNIRVFNKYKGK